MSQTLPYQPVPQKSRSGCWTAFLILLTTLAGAAVLIGGGMFWLFNGLARSEGATQALKIATETPAVTAQFGAPLKRGSFATGSYAVNTNGTGEIDLALPISGPKGSGTLLITGTRTNHVWGFSRISAMPDGGREIPVK